MLLLGIAAAGGMYYRWSNNRKLDSLFKGGAQSRSISVKQRASITNPTYATSEQSEHVTAYDTTDGAGVASDHGSALNNPVYAGPSATYAVPMETEKSYDTTDGPGFAFDHGSALNNPAYTPAGPASFTNVVVARPSTVYAVPMETENGTGDYLEVVGAGDANVTILSGKTEPRYLVLERPSYTVQVRAATSAYNQLAEAPVPPLISDPEIARAPMAPNPVYIVANDAMPPAYA